MSQTFKAVEVIKSYDNGSKDIIIETPCKRCSGNGVFNQYKHINNGRCYECEGTGVNEKEIKANKDDTILIVSRTTEVKQTINTTKHENEMVRKALKSHYEERKQFLKDAHESHKRMLEEERQLEEDIKNNPDDYTFTWDD